MLLKLFAGTTICGTRGAIRTEKDIRDLGHDIILEARLDNNGMVLLQMNHDVGVYNKSDKERCHRTTMISAGTQFILDENHQIAFEYAVPEGEEIIPDRKTYSFYAYVKEQH
tara:strand:+ start:1836 stop:2171 length:336 start_codon:yes stop_codon:yes gene_type:complete